MSDTIQISRAMMHHPIVGIQKPARFVAWTWMLMEARWKDSRLEIAGETVELKRGQLSHSLRFMADKLPLTLKELRTFIGALKKAGMIRVDTGAKTGTASGTRQSIITICNYEKYQLEPGYRKHEGAQQRHSKGTAGAQRRIPEEIPDEIPESSGGGPDGPDLFQDQAVSDAQIFWAFVNPLAERADLPPAKVRPILGKLLKAADGDVSEVMQHVAFAVSGDCAAPVSFLMQKARDLSNATPEYGPNWSPFGGDRAAILSGPRE